MGVQRRFLKRVGEYRYRYQGSLGGEKYCSESKFKTRAEAQEAERVHRLMMSGDHQLLQEYIDLRLLHLKQTMSTHYWRENKYFLGMLLNHCGNIPIQQVSKQQVHKLLLGYHEDLVNRGKTPHRANYLMRSLKAFFNYVIDIHDIQIRNPVKGLQKFSIKHRLKYIPPKRHIEEVALHLLQHQWELYRFVEETGCRVMEAVRLESKDCQPRGRNPHVILWTRKAKNSDLTPRRIPFPECLRGREIARSGRVFPEWDTYPAFLYKTVVELKLKPTWNWHNLRHRRASIWASQGMNIVEIMQRLGHSNLSTTQGYLQLLGFTY